MNIEGLTAAQGRRLWTNAGLFAGLIAPVPAPAAVPGSQATDTATAITNVTVIDVERGIRLPAQTVLVRGSRIVAVQPAATATLPGNLRTIDGSGKYLIPGLWDMHTHANSAEVLTRMVEHGITGTRVMWGNPATVTARARIARGEILGPIVVTAGPIIEGLPPPAFASVVDTAGRTIVKTAEDAIAAVRAQQALGYDFIKIYNNVPREAYDAIIREARRLNLPVAGHVPFAAGLRAVLADRLASVEHLRGYPELLVPAEAPQQPGVDLRSRLLASRYADTTRFAALAQETQRAGVWNTPTLSVRLFSAPESTVVRYLGAEAAQAFLRNRARIPWLSNFTAEDFRQAEEGSNRMDRFVVALRHAGAGLLAGTDMGPWGPTLHRELALLVGAGLTPAEALQAATINPARFLGAADSLGTVAAGRRADLVLLDADPLADIRNTTRIAAVWVAGRQVDRRGTARVP